jgi:SPP1 gp7 family putative phage head morphogenesis protein
MLKQLNPIKETPQDYEEIEKAIIKIFRKEIYLPLVKLLAGNSKTLTNSQGDLLDAIVTGRITFHRGKFQGRFNSTLSRALRSIGAEWDRKQGCFLVPQSKLPEEIVHAISLSKYRFEKSLEVADRKLRSIDHAKIADNMKLSEMMDKTLWRTNKRFERSIQKITVSPKLTPDQSARIAQEYTKNLELYITEFTQKETEELRKNIKERVLKGGRYESIVSEIQKSFGVSVRKAKFLARQETMLMTTKFKQVRYESIGADWYVWRCVAGSPNHPVRPMHKKNDGKRFRWDTGAVINEQGEKKNPGQDYGCRCYAVPLVKF